MGDYSYRVTNALLGSELLPASWRTRVMRLAGFAISPQTTIWAGANLRSKRIRMGPGVFVNVGFYHDGYDWLEVGCNVRIGPYVRILTATHDIGPAHQRCLIEVVGKPVTIGDGCWLGTGVTVMPGVNIAKGCVIAAASLVIKSTEPNGLYIGTPARRVRDLQDTVAEAVVAGHPSAGRQLAAHTELTDDLCTLMADASASRELPPAVAPGPHGR